MDLTLLLSLALRSLAILWALLLWQRVRDWSPLLLSGLLLATIVHLPFQLFPAGDAVPASGHFSELMGSLVALAIVWTADRMPWPIRDEAAPTGSGHRPNPTATARTAWSALAIAATAMAGSIGVGFLAYTNSRHAVLNTVANESLAMARTVVSQVEFDLEQQTSLDRQTAVDLLNSEWTRTDPPHPGSYLCVIDSSGHLVLHTGKRGMVGADVSQVIVDSGSRNPRLVGQLLESKQSLSTHNVSFGGQPQLAGYQYMASIDSLVVVHVPSKLVEDDVRRAAAPWALAFTLIGVVLIPFSVGLIHYSYVGAQRAARVATAAQIRSERELREQLAELELVYRTAPVGLCLMNLQLQFLRINDQLAAMSGKPAEVHAGRTVRELLPDAADFLEPILRHVIETGTAELGLDVDRADPQNPRQVLNYLASFFPLQDQSGEVLGVSSVFQNITAIRRAEANLRDSEQRFRRMVDGLPELIWVSDAERNATHVNKQWLQYTGRALRAELGSGWVQCVHEDDVEIFHEVFSAAISDRGRFEVEYRLLGADGQYRWFLNCGMPWYDAEGEFSGYIGACVDITKRRELEETFEFQAHVLNRVSDAVVVADGQGVITYANEAAEQVFRISRRCQDQSKTLSELHDELLVSGPASDVIRSSLLASGSWQGENEFLVDGELRSFETRVTTFESPNGADRFLLSMARDISSRMQAEKERERIQHDLHESEEKLRSVLDTATDLIISIDLDGKIRYVNRTPAGESIEEIIQGAFAVGNADADESTSHGVMLFRQAMDRVRWSSAPHEYEYQREDADGTACFSCRMGPMLRDDQVIGFTLCMTDVTHREKAEQESRQHRQTLAHVARLSTMGELVAGIAHEVKQPLHAVANFATAMSLTLEKLQSADQSQAADPRLGELKECNDGVRAASQRASEIIQRMRSFARKSEPVRDAVDPNSIIQNAIDLVAFEARQFRATVELEFSADLPLVAADPIQCEQVVVNLLHNAYEALAETEMPRRVIVSSRRQDHNLVEIQVTDNGHGFGEQQVQRVFETFYTTKRDGMGMGLAISRTIVEDHGGKLWAENNSLGGATFHFTLPMALPPQYRSSP